MTGFICAERVLQNDGVSACIFLMGELDKKL